MNYQEFEQHFRYEQLALDHQLQLDPKAVDYERLDKDWTMVRGLMGGTWAGHFSAGMLLLASVAIAIYGSSQLTLLIPALISIASITVYLIVIPVYRLPTENLERFTVAELSQELLNGQHSLNRRFKADKIFLFPFLVLGWLWVMNVRFGVDPILNPELLPSGTLFYTALAVLAFYTLGTWMERQANVQYGEVQQKLRSYVDEDYV